MNSRIWKKFFQKLMLPLKFMLFIIGLIFIINQAKMQGVSSETITFILLVGTIVSLLTLTLQTMWYSAKREVEYENRKILNDIERG
jgi:hypothetical protein